MIIADCGIQDHECKELLRFASGGFKSVALIPTSHKLTDESWPKGANWLFQTACRYFKEQGGSSFLWLEPDCVPLIPKWLEALEAEYIRCKKLFMGADINGKQLSGIAIYPPNSLDLYRDFFREGISDRPWDYVVDARPMGHVTDLIQHVWGKKGLPPTFVKIRRPGDAENVMSLSCIDPHAALFHRCKDTSLINLLREQHVPNSISVVITNFKRPEFLKMAFESAVDAGACNIVVTSSGTTPAVQAVHKQLHPRPVIVSEEGDSGCNANWLAGITAAPTEWVTLLHDDDLLMPAFRMVARYATNKVGFVLWDARRHGMGFKDVYPVLDLPTGVYPTRKLLRNLLIPNSFTLSPTIGCFRKEDVIATLHEAQDNFGADFHIKPTMMVGNDLLIWLRAIQKHRYFQYIKAPLTSFGHHPGSTTCDEVFNRRGKLAPIYNKVREHFLRTFQGIVHVVPRFHPKNSDTQRRIVAAEASWSTLYSSGIVRPLHIWNNKRDSSRIGDNRRTPFLKDLLVSAIESTTPREFVMLTNDDDILHPDLTWHLLDTLIDEPAVCAFRQSFHHGKCPDLSVHRDFFPDEPHDWGRDLFAFRREWLINHLDTIPDYVMGSSDWDSTLATIIRLSKGIATTRDTWVTRDPRCELPTGFVYHEFHQAAWSTPVARQTLPGNLYNRKLTKEFIAKHGVGCFV